MVSKYIKNFRIKMIGLIIAGIILVMAVEVSIVLPNVVNNISEFYLFIFVFIPGIIIGIPFPLLLAEMNEYKLKYGIALLLSISGIAGFIGSVAVVITAIVSGYKFVMMLSLFSYALIIVIIISQSKKSDILYDTQQK